MNTFLKLTGYTLIGIVLTVLGIFFPVMFLVYAFLFGAYLVGK